jgi:hypothetical protein
MAMRRLLNLLLSGQQVTLLAQRSSPLGIPRKVSEGFRKQCAHNAHQVNMTQSERATPALCD